MNKTERHHILYADNGYVQRKARFFLIYLSKFNMFPCLFRINYGTANSLYIRQISLDGGSVHRKVSANTGQYITTNADKRLCPSVNRARSFRFRKVKEDENNTSATTFIIWQPCEIFLYDKILDGSL
jgi:hypothetical protein